MDLFLLFSAAALVLFAHGGKTERLNYRRSLYFLLNCGYSLVLKESHRGHLFVQFGIGLDGNSVSFFFFSSIVLHFG